MWGCNTLARFEPVAAADPFLGTYRGRNMDETTQADAVYELVTTTFADLGATDAAIPTILLKDGYFVGYAGRLKSGSIQR
jgi:hypothetical protein